VAVNALVEAVYGFYASNRYFCSYGLAEFDGVDVFAFDFSVKVIWALAEPFTAHFRDTVNTVS
jgi:hypothetical protein